MTLRIWPGSPRPLGASYDGHGTNFAVCSAVARKVEVALFHRPDDPVEYTRVVLGERTGHIHHTYVPGIGPGTLYGLRVHGPFEPARGLWCNPHKLLVDPYARAVATELDWRAPVEGYVPGSEKTTYALDDRDSAWGAPRCVVVADDFDWRGDRPPATPWSETVIYEVHVKGFTARHPDVPEAVRGTYAGLASDAAIAHLKGLGVTAVELLPIHEFATEKGVHGRGLVNYWGYNTLAFLAPAGRYSAAGRLGGQVAEFKEMVRRLHAAGIEVILDVVYNHTAENDAKGPTLSLRGLDASAYYRLDPVDRSKFLDFTGCGNTLDTRHPHTLELVLESLRAWVLDMHVDGFRFDLAPALGRGETAFEPTGTFLGAVYQDPVLRRVKLIAEPWDLGSGGYQVGGFPPPWSEWNGRYRDTVRRFWAGADGQAGDLGYRLTGSSDLYGGSGRGPSASVNFVTVHDGFTLEDLVSYAKKHNEANGEQNRDGSDGNDSTNGGIEGPTDDPTVVALRDRMKRNFLTTLMISQGVPMISGGDEIGRTQGGNNNAYCQDNATSWHDWQLDDKRRSLLAFVKRLAALRASEPGLRRTRFLPGGAARAGQVVWYGPEGQELTGEEWTSAATKALGIWLAGEATGRNDEQGRPVHGSTLFIALNALDEPVNFHVPPVDADEDAWEVLVDTAVPEPPRQLVGVTGGATYRLVAKAMAVMRMRRSEANDSPSP